MSNPPWRQALRFKAIHIFASILGVAAIWYFLTVHPSPIRDPNFGALERPVKPEYAIATFLTGKSISQEDERDDYFIATRILAY